MPQTIILGAGLSGCLAGVMNPDAVILEAKSSDKFMASPEHKAVLRFRSDKISKITGIPFKEVQVRKSIWHEGREFRLPDIRFTNMYSRKVVGGYFDRSIVNLETMTRWSAPEDFHFRLLKQCRDRVHFDSPVKVIGTGAVMIGDESGVRETIPRDDGDVIISTLAVPFMAKILGLESPVSFSAGRRVWVERYRVKNCNLNVSMYYPDDRISVYRASIMGNLLSIEMISETTSPEMRRNMIEVMSSLGINEEDLTYVDGGSQLGKLDYNLNDKIRKDWILKLTLDYGIYSLGRFAIWKNVLQDDVYEDALRIRGWVASGSNYDLVKSVRTQGNE